MPFQKSWADKGKDHTCHHGLRFFKFFGQWHEEGEEQKSTDPILDWLDPPASFGARTKGGSPARLQIGNSGRLAEAAARMKSLAARRGTTFELCLISRLLTGIGLPHPTENGFLFHPTLAVPYLRGTALKQVARDWAEADGVCGARLGSPFGATSSGAPVAAGKLGFLDALPLDPVPLAAEVITPHYGPYYQEETRPAGGSRGGEPADWYDPVPVSLLCVDAGIQDNEPLRFQFAILALRDATKTDAEDAAEWLRRGLDELGVGAKTTLGYGRLVGGERRQELIAIARRLTERDWTPVVGDSVFHNGAPVKILELRRDGQARVFHREDGEYLIALAELTRQS